MRIWTPLLFLFLFLGTPATATEYCQDQDLVLDLQTTWDFRADFLQDYGLATHREGQLYPMPALLQVANETSQGEMQASFQFPRKANEVGLAYNLYRLEIQIGSDDEPDRQIIDQDYTASCTEAGASLWPGDHLNLNALKVLPHSDGTARGREPVHLRFWGK